MSTISSSTTSTTAFGVTADTTGALVIQTGSSPTTALTIDTGQRSTFPTTIAVGGATPSTSGSGISFPATQSASSDANTLDDYEEGTFAPTFTASGSALSSVTYSVQNGKYTKIGRQVYVEFYVRFTAYSGGSGNAWIGGLPFTATSGTFGIFPVGESTGVTATGTFYSLIGEMNSSSTTIGLLKAGPSSATTSLTLTEVGAATTVYFIMSGCYTTT
jgi:hypothetical protein